MLILPFANLTGTDSLKYFVSGMHASLIQDLGRISGINVINRITYNVYKNVDKPLHKIARELNVDAVIEADIMCLADSICQGVRLISGSNDEELLWMGDYKKNINKVLNLYNNITRQIAYEIKVELTPEEERSPARTRTVDRDAYDAYLRSHQYWDDFRKESLIKAMEYLNSVIEKDPDWAPLYTGLAQVWLAIQHVGLNHPLLPPQRFTKTLTKPLNWIRIFQNLIT